MDPGCDTQPTALNVSDPFNCPQLGWSKINPSDPING